MMKNIKIFTFLLVALLVGACDPSTDGNTSGVTPTPAVSTPASRTMAMGFTPAPYAASQDSVDFVYSQIFNNGDIVAHHLDAGIPWQEALVGAAYPPVVESEIVNRLRRTPSNAKVYLAVSPFSSLRDGIAGYWSSATNLPLPPEWAARDFDSPEVIQAYTNFASDLISRFDPDYFNLGIEASELAINDPARFQRFVIFCERVSASLHSLFPQLPLLVSVALKSPDSVAAQIIRQQMPQVIQHVDMLGASVYPYIFFTHANRGNPLNMPPNWLSQLQELAAGKPMAVAETGWAAETLDIPELGVNIPITEADQNNYVVELLNQSEALGMEFVIWFAIADYDSLWVNQFNQDALTRIWRDIGLFDQNLNSRPGLDSWRRKLLGTSQGT